MSLYNTSALYNQNMSNDKQNDLKSFYNEIFKSFQITTIHDCTIGAGGTTLPLAKLGYTVTGSDLSKNLVEKASENFIDAGYESEIFVADLRDVENFLPATCDCVISTGNSLAHVNNDDLAKFFESVSKSIPSGSLLYFDTRNWDKLLKNRPIFKARDPLVMDEVEHKSLYQIFDWHDDKSVDFVFVTSVDKNGKHEKTSYTYAPRYYPFELNWLTQKLNASGFNVIKLYDLDRLWFGKENSEKTGNFESDFYSIDWYGVLAQKN